MYNAKRKKIVTFIFEFMFCSIYLKIIIHIALSYNLHNQNVVKYVEKSLEWRTKNDSVSQASKIKCISVCHRIPRFYWIDAISSSRCQSAQKFIASDVKGIARKIFRAIGISLDHTVEVTLSMCLEMLKINNIY